MRPPITLDRIGAENQRLYQSQRRVPPAIITAAAAPGPTPPSLGSGRTPSDRMLLIGARLTGLLVAVGLAVLAVSGLDHRGTPAVAGGIYPHPVDICTLGFPQSDCGFRP